VGKGKGKKYHEAGIKQEQEDALDVHIKWPSDNIDYIYIKYKS
jgi:hypothetical protein